MTIVGLDICEAGHVQFFFLEGFVASLKEVLLHFIACVLAVVKWLSNVVVGLYCRTIELG